MVGQGRGREHGSGGGRLRRQALVFLLFFVAENSSLLPGIKYTDPRKGGLNC